MQNQNTACQAMRFTNFPPWWSSACLWRWSCYTVSGALLANRSDVELYFFFRSRDLQILGLVDAKSGKAWMNWTSFTNGAIEANYHANAYNSDYNCAIPLLFYLSRAPPSLVTVRTAWHDKRRARLGSEFGSGHKILKILQRWCSTPLRVSHARIRISVNARS